MNKTQMFEELLEVINDSPVNGIWSDDTLLGYLAEGQDVFCERTGYFKDLSNFSITLQTDTATYSIPARVIQVLSIWDSTRKLTKIPTGERYLAADAEGVPAYWTTDEETGIITLYPTPTSDQNGTSLTLQVWRYSIYDLVEATREPEIPDQFRRALIHFAAAKAFEHHDMEQEDPIEAADHFKRFDEYVVRAKRGFRRYHNKTVRVGVDPAYRA